MTTGQSASKDKHKNAKQLQTTASEKTNTNTELDFLSLITYSQYRKPKSGIFGHFLPHSIHLHCVNMRKLEIQQKRFEEEKTRRTHARS